MEQRNVTSEDIMNEIDGIEFEDDDALTLLDDEEMQSAIQETDDDDLNSFYLDYPDDEEKVNVNMYTEEINSVKEVPVVEEVATPVVAPVEPIHQAPVVQIKEEPKEDVIPTINNGYQNRLDKLSTNIDAYLNGHLDNRHDEVKVEKMEPVVVPAPQVERRPEPIIQPKPVVQPITPVSQSTSGDNTNLNQLFNRASDNVRNVTDIKKKMEDKFNELQRLYAEFEKKKKADYDEINAYKDDVYNKLKDKKEELDNQARELKTQQDILANQKKQFEAEKLRIKEETKKKEQELEDAFKEREKNIEQVENGLIRRKEQLDQEKLKISKERAQVEQEKKDLADNLVKFNQLVDDFTKGVDRFGENN